jgi:hypothetical protein
MVIFLGPRKDIMTTTTSHMPAENGKKSDISGVHLQGSDKFRDSLTGKRRQLIREWVVRASDLGPHWLRWQRRQKRRLQRDDQVGHIKRREF